jgi:hypothetical protein
MLHMRASAGLAKSFLSLEEDVLNAGLGQGLKYWCLPRSYRRPLQIVVWMDSAGRAARCLWGCVQRESGQRESNLLPSAISVSLLDRFGDEGPQEASVVNKIDQIAPVAIMIYAA